MPVSKLSRQFPEHGLVSTARAAAFLGCSPRSIRRGIVDDTLPLRVTVLAGRRYVSAAAVRAMLDGPAPQPAPALPAAPASRRARRAEAPSPSTGAWPVLVTPGVAR